MKIFLISSSHGRSLLLRKIDTESTLQTLENDFLADVHSISVIDMGKHFSQFSNLPESQNLCELREAALSQ